MLRISSFSIEALNDLYNYTNCSVDDPLSDLIILYGDNGSGKTTILNLIFHLLSSRPDQGHLNAIVRVPFKSIRVNLSDGTIVSAERPGDVKSLPILFKLTRPNSRSVEYRFFPETLRDQSYFEMLEKSMIQKAIEARGVRAQKLRSSQVNHYLPDETSHKTYISALEKLGITCYYMATDRRMRCDLIEEKKPTGRQSQEFEASAEDVISRVRIQYLKDALNSAARFINRQIIGASNKGSKNANDTYTELIKRIAQEDLSSESMDLNTGMRDAVLRLDDLARQNKKFSDLGFAPALDFSDIITTIKNAANHNKAALHKILQLYIDSLDARLIALHPVGAVIETFLMLLNSLFKHKSVTFSPTDGFMIFGPKGKKPLETEQLSSGEQQLLLMFCYLLVSNENQSIFMIDEPEISLNVKWQRELIDAMREITKDSRTQIVIATHSIELLSQYADRVIALDPQISDDNAFVYDNTQKNDR